MSRSCILLHMSAKLRAKKTGKYGPYDQSSQPRRFHRRTIGFSEDEDTLIRRGADIANQDVAGFIREAACSKARRLVA